MTRCKKNKNLSFLTRNPMNVKRLIRLYFYWHRYLFHYGTPSGLMFKFLDSKFLLIIPCIEYGAVHAYHSSTV